MNIRPNAVELQSIFDAAELLFSKEQIEFAIDQIAVKLSVEFAEADPVLVCIMKGGLVFTSDLMQRLRFPLTVDFIHVSRYQDKLAPDELTWLVHPTTDLTGRTVILLDDVLDYGITLAEVAQHSMFTDVKQLVIAVMLDKELDRAKPIHPDFVALHSDDRYVFGRGMDCKGYFRNLPEIYALPKA